MGLAEYPKEYHGVLYFANEVFGKEDKMEQTVSEVIAKKLTLQQSIIDLLKAFEEDTGLLVGSMYLVGCGEETDRDLDVEIIVSL